MNDLLERFRTENARLESELAEARKKPEPTKLQTEHLFEKMQNEIDRLTAENEAKDDVLRKIKDWCRAYPLEVFPEPDLKKAAKVLKEAGMTLDSISASNMRHVLKGIQKIIEGGD